MKRLSDALILLDSSYPADFATVQGWLAEAGFAGVDGQTTNPSYFIKKNPDIAARFERGERFTNDELFGLYRETVKEIYALNAADTLVEVYADAETSAEEMIDRARELATWVPKVRIKLPIIPEGLKAAEVLCREVRLNMTLGFSQEQAAAVYAATRGAKYPVFHSAFVGRLTDRGEDGVANVANVKRMLMESDGHVLTLAASFRDVDQIVACLQMGADVLTINYDRFELWREAGFAGPDEEYAYSFEGTAIPYREISLDKDWQEYDIYHDLTESGLKQFADDWNSLLVAS